MTVDELMARLLELKAPDAEVVAETWLDSKGRIETILVIEGARIPLPWKYPTNQDYSRKVPCK